MLETVKTTAGVLAARWCLDHYIPFKYSEKQLWTLISYERLLTQTERELQRVTAALDAEVTLAMRKAIEVDGGRVDQVETETQQQLSKWKRHLSTRQTDDILRLVEAFDLDFYTRRTEPEYDRLMQFQNAQPQNSTQ